jgi:V/A-type H+-transporting ATPase subunit I
MSKVEIAGPKGMLQDVLSLLQETGIFQIEPEVVGFIGMGDEAYIRSFLLDEKDLSERLFLEDLRDRINDLFFYLPDVPVRKSYIKPISIIDVLANTIRKHIATCKGLYRRREEFQKELNELSRYGVFLDALESLIGGAERSPGLDFTGLTIKDHGSIEELRKLLSSLTKGKFALVTAAAGDGTLVGLITAERYLSEKIKKALSDEDIPELSFPPSLSALSFPEKIKGIKTRIPEIAAEISSLTDELERFSGRWMPIYQRVMEWVNERLSLLKASASVFESEMCFFIYGWIPYEGFNGLRDRLNNMFKGKVLLQEKEFREEDIERVPVVLQNPAYFQPFEFFVKLLPLPRYSSFDPTPFIGIFFPLFFGMILGDAGYGLILMAASLFMIKRFRGRKNIQDASRILLISSVYAVFFGVLYGEFLGELPRMLFGLEPLCVERRTAVMPVLYFSVAVGIGHIIFGLFLGFIAALRKKTKREALYRMLTIIIILCLIALAASFFGVFPAMLAKPIIIAILALAPLLFFTGGILAPFELLKSIGNMISYARIMAIGLTSVLLAFAANQLAGMTGNIVLGIVVAGLLHILNIILGVFSPAIHSLRLHYVEFFSKFIEHGGRRFEPLKK